MWVKRKGGEGRREERQEDEGTTMIIAKQTKQREKQYYRARGRWPGGNFQLKTNAYKCAHMEKAPPHTHVCATLPAFLSACGISPPPLRSLLHFHAGLRLAVDVNVNVEAAGCK